MGIYQAYTLFEAKRSKTGSFSAAFAALKSEQSSEGTVREAIPLSSFCSPRYFTAANVATIKNERLSTTHNLRVVLCCYRSDQ
jgi:hypothetical protein